MPAIPPTRRKYLKSPDQDHIQWTLTNQNQKTVYSRPPKSSPTKVVTTLSIAKKFLVLDDLDNDKNKINEIINDIKYLESTTSFSTRTFIQHVIEHASNLTSLLRKYYAVSAQLDIFALTTRCVMVLDFMPELDEPLCELFSSHESVGEAYIQALDEKTLNRLFVKDGKKFVDWSGLMKRENINRLLSIVKRYSDTMKKDQCLNLLLQLNTSKVDNVNELYYNQVRRVKEFIFTPNKMTSKQSDTLFAKSPLLQIISTWFFEFEHESSLELSDFALNVFNLGIESRENVPDISLLLYVYNTGCKQLSLEGKGHIQIPDIIATLSRACKKSLEQDNSGGLAVILTLAQFAFEQMHASVGYTYANWFQDTFIHASTSILNKKTGMVFINVLEQLTHYELPSILQIHGKALHHCTNISSASIYVSTVKKRLLDLGVDSTFKNYPQSMKTPLQTVTVVLEDEINDIIQQFVKRDQVIPHSLLSAAVFRRAWFTSTFLPKLFFWQGKEMEARDRLIEALRKDKKIPDAMYNDFIQQQKK